MPLCFGVAHNDEPVHAPAVAGVEHQAPGMRASLGRGFAQKTMNCYEKQSAV